MRTGIALMLCLVLCLCTGAGLGEVQLTLEPAEWTWEAGAVATFQGRLDAGGEDLTGATLTLAIEVDPQQEDPGRVVFTSLNDKRLKVRKQTETHTLEASDVPLMYTGSWFLAEESYYNGATLRLTLTDPAGKELARTEYAAESGSAAGEGQEGQHFRVPVDMNQVIRVLLIACGAVWLAFACRIIWRKLQRKTQSV